MRRGLERPFHPRWATPVASRRARILAMTDIGDSLLRKGQDVWVVGPDGSRRPAEYVGDSEASAWFGGPPTVLVVYPDVGESEAVEVDRVIARD
jgi:hypothetical protein